MGKTGKKPKYRLQEHITHSLKRVNGNHRMNWVRSLLSRGAKPILEVIDEVSEENWRQWEVAWIEFFQETGCRLVNGTPGGDGTGAGEYSPAYGKKRSLSTVQKISEIHRGRKRKITASRFIGVSRDRNNNTWRAQIEILGTAFRLGNYKNDEDAAHTYDWVARLYFGKEARVNFP